MPSVPAAIARIWTSGTRVQGRQVRNLMQETVRPGTYGVRWDRADDSGRPVDPGLYYYRLVAGERTFEKRMVTLH